MDAASLLQLASAFALNSAFCWLAGSWCARQWLAPSAAHGLRRPDAFAAILGTVAGVSWLWAATAIMAGLPLAEARQAFWTMMSTTDQGRAGCITVLAMLALLAASLAGRGRAVATGLALLVFAVTRASMGHAGSEGLLSAPLLAEALHLAGVGVWTGLVMVSGWHVLRPGRIPAMPTTYLQRMSHASTFAVLLIAATGIYSGLNRVGATEHLLHTSYGMALLLKVGLVILAIGLGGFNKFFSLPAAARSQRWIRLLRQVLVTESVILAAALLAACWLTAQQPPMAA